MSYYLLLAGRKEPCQLTLLLNEFRSRQTNKNSEKGFILIEMLCALIIFGIASVAFLQISSASAFHMKEAKFYNQKFKYAQSMIDLERNKKLADFREDSGQDILEKINWNIIVEPISKFKSNNAEQPQLAKIIIEVTSAGEYQKKKLKLETVLTYGQTGL